MKLPPLTRCSTRTVTPSRPTNMRILSGPNQDMPTRHVFNSKIAFPSSEKAVPAEIPAMEIGTFNNWA